MFTKLNRYYVRTIFVLLIVLPILNFIICFWYGSASGDLPLFAGESPEKLKEKMVKCFKVTKIPVNPPPSDFPSDVLKWMKNNNKNSQTSLKLTKICKYFLTLPFFITSTMYPMPMGTVYINQQMEEERKAAKKRHINKRYPLLLRATLKFAQLALAAAILRLVLGPIKSYTFHDFVTRIETECQGEIVGIVSVFGILTLILFVTLFCGYATATWRKLDAFITGAGWFLYILVAFLEAYFASCYQPNGKNHPEVCHREKWIIACILASFNLIFYIIDFIFILRTGVSLG